MVLPQGNVDTSRNLEHFAAPFTQADLHPCTRLETAIDCKAGSQIPQIRAFVPASHLLLQFNRDWGGDHPN